MTAPTLTALIELIRSRKDASPEASYVAKMFAKGRKKLTQKVGEEATEVVIAALAEGKQEQISESADLLFHLCLLWEECGITPDEVMAELEGRMGQSGLDEKAARKSK